MFIGISHNKLSLSSALDAIEVRPGVSTFTLKVFNVDADEIILSSKYYCPAASIMVYGLGEVIENYMLSNNLTLSSFGIQIVNNTPGQLLSIMKSLTLPVLYFNAATAHPLSADYIVENQFLLSAAYPLAPASPGMVNLAWITIPGEQRSLDVKLHCVTPEGENVTFGHNFPIEGDTDSYAFNSLFFHIKSLFEIVATDARSSSLLIRQITFSTGRRHFSLFISDKLTNLLHLCVRNEFNVPEFISLQASSEEKLKFSADIVHLISSVQTANLSRELEYNIEAELPLNDARRIARLLASPQGWLIDSPDINNEGRLDLNEATAITISEVALDSKNTDPNLSKLKFTYVPARRRLTSLLLSLDRANIFQQPFNPSFN